MTEWIRVKDGLPPTEGLYFEGPDYFVFDGEDVFIASWMEVDTYDHEEARGHIWRFGYVDGTECRCAYENITHWGEIIFPEPPHE